MTSLADLSTREPQSVTLTVRFSLNPYSEVNAKIKKSLTAENGQYRFYIPGTDLPA